MAEEITVSQAKLNDPQDFEWTTGTDGESEYYFELIQDNAVLIAWNDGTSDSDATIEIQPGDYWQKGNEEYVPLEFDLDQATEDIKMVVLESAKYKDENGRVNLEVKGDAATSDDEEDLHFAVVQMPLFGVSIAD